MHGHKSENIPAKTALAARISALSDEFLSAAAERRDAIGEEISGLIAGRIVPLPLRD